MAAFGAINQAYSVRLYLPLPAPTATPNAYSVAFPKAAFQQALRAVRWW